MSYSRHAVADEDLTMNHDVNYRVHMHVRRMMSENKAMRRRKARDRRQQAASAASSSLGDVENPDSANAAMPRSRVNKKKLGY